MAVKESKRKFEEMGGNVRNFEESWALRGRRWCRESKKKKKGGESWNWISQRGLKSSFILESMGKIGRS